MSRRPLVFLLPAAVLVAAALGAISMGTPATAAVAPPQCLTNLVVNVFAGNPTVLPAAPCSDPDGDALTIIVVDGPSHGVLGAQAADGTRTYTADASYVGSDALRFKASDGSSESAVSTLTINVQPASATAPPGGPQDLDPPVPQDVEPASDPVDPGSCVGRGPRRAQNGLMVSENRGAPLKVFRPDGRGRERALTHPNRRQQDSSPTWSPNGRRVAFQRVTSRRRRGGEEELWTVAVASGRERRIVRRAGSPAWSPDGRWIAFSYAGLKAIRPDGTGERLIGTAFRSVEVPNWSPNGRCFAGRAFDNEGLGSHLGLAIMDSGGGSPHVILPYEPLFASDTAVIDEAPSWSHDGRQLLIVGKTSFSPHETRLVQVNVDGTNMRILTTPFRHIAHAFYSPDGRTIAFSRYERRAGVSTKRGVYTMPAGGGRSRLVIPRRDAVAWGPRAASPSAGVVPRPGAR